jgi:hypothetical protein
MQAIGMDPGLEIAVETETGKSRTVRWYGPDVPGELIKLAEIALVPGGVRAMENLGEALRATAGGRPEPESLAILRQLMGTLGAGRVSELPARVQGLMRELDNLGQDIASMAGVEIGSDGANLRALLEKIRTKHREALANQMAGAQATLNKAIAEHRAQVTRQAVQHDEFRRSVPAQIEQAMAIERNARAAVQVELDVLRKTHESVRAARDRAQREGQATREALELAEGTQRDLTAKLSKAREGLEYARAQYYTPQEEIGEARWGVDVSREIVAGIDKALKASDPDA